VQLSSLAVRRSVVAAALAIIGVVQSVAAQPAVQPQRPRRGILGAPRPSNPNGIGSVLTISAALNGGWENSLAPEFTPVFAPRPEAGSFYGSGSGTLNYRLGGNGWSFATSSQTSANGFSTIGSEPLISSTLNMSGSSPLGRNSQLNLSAGLGYRPTFMMAAQALAAGQTDPSVADPSGGVTRTNSLGIHSTVGVGHSWTQRHQTSMGYTFSRQQFTNGAMLDTDGHAATVSHSWGFARRTGVSVAYSYSMHNSEGTSLEDAVGHHTLNAGMNFAIGLSRLRQVAVGLGGGASYVRGNASTGGQYGQVSPSGYASAGLNLWRGWGISTSYRRSASVLTGISRVAFMTDNATLSAGGSVGGLFAASVSAAYSSGSATGSDSGGYEGIAGIAQLNFAFSRCCSVVTSYSHFEHNIRRLSTVPTGFPTRFARDFFRVGLSVQLPLYGNF
jgi:hypothetical protein